MKIKFSNLARLKFALLKDHGFTVTKQQVKDTVVHPDKIEEGAKGRVVAQKAIDESHVLRVVYEISVEAWEIITFYPGRRSRCEN